MSYIDINISKKINNNILNASLQIDKGDFIAISGDSGSAKTTLLRIIAGFEKADGHIIVNNDIWLDENISLKTQKRDIGFVSQEYSLFDNMSVLQNLLFVNKDLNLANHLLKISNILELRDKPVYALSGGEQQRVALCRAFMNKSKLILLDEPFSALDNNIKNKLYKELQLLHKKFNNTIIMVSHSVKEIYHLSNKIFYIQKNKMIVNNKTNITKDKAEYILSAEVVDIIQDENKAIILFDNQLIDINIQNKTLSIGEIINIKIKKDEFNII
jgi:molybdate transport system ATP-binding protein